MLGGSIGCWFCPTHMSCSHILNRTSKKKKKKNSDAKWVGLTGLHLRDIQSDHSIAMADVKRDSLTYYLCHWELMDTVLKKNKKTTNLLRTSMTTRLSQGVSTSLPLHPCTTRGFTAQGPGTTFTITNKTFIPSLLVSSIQLVILHVEGVR